MTRFGAILVFTICLVFGAQTANAKTVILKNLLTNADVDVLLTPVGSTQTRTVRIAENGSSPFDFEGTGLFDIQVRPLDKDQNVRASGTNLVQQDLTPFAVPGNVFGLGGEIGRVTFCYTYRHHHRCRCCCYAMDGQRTSITFESTLPDGKPFFRRLPLMYYGTLRTQPTERVMAAYSPVPEAVTSSQPAEKTMSQEWRTWTNKSGTFSVVARLLYVEDGKAHFEKTNGERICGLLDELSTAGQNWIAAWQSSQRLAQATRWP